MAASRRRPADPPNPVARRRLAALAWVTVLAISLVPDAAWTELTGRSPVWLPLAKAGLLLALAVLAWSWRPVRPLRDFFVVMLAFVALTWATPRVDLTWGPLQSLFGGTAFDARMQAEQTAKLVAALGMIGVLFLLGYRRRTAFLTRGNLRAPITPVPVLGFPRSVPWTRFGLQWGLSIALALAAFLYLGQRPSGETMLAVVPMAASILFYAALNAFNEEVTFRVPMLATLERATGSGQALWQSAVFFGFAHYFGVPGGLLGGVLSVFMGWILGKAMLETRGLFWSWWIHFLSDVAIFTFLAAALVVP